MPEMQPSAPASSAAMAPMLDLPASTPEESDYPLGCECANPALQIAWWGEEARPSASEGR